MKYPASKMFTTTWLNTLKPDTKIHRIRDIQTPGLHIFVRPSGTIGWVYRYTYLSDKGKKEHTFYTFGKYTNKGPRIKRTLADAREYCTNVLMPLADEGVNLKTHFKNNPLVVQKENTVREMFRYAFRGQTGGIDTGLFPEEFDPKIPGFIDDYKLGAVIDNDRVGYGAARDMKSRVETYLLPHLGDRDVREVTPNELIEVIRNIKPVITGEGSEKKIVHKFSVRKKLFQDIKCIFNYAQNEFKMLYSPAQGVDMTALTKDADKVEKHMVTTTDVEGIQKIMWKISSHINTSTRMSWQMKAATLALALTHLRPKELAGLRWTEIDFKNDLIDIPGKYGVLADKPEKRMKMGYDHIVPISRQLKGLLIRAKECSKEDKIVSRYVFPKVTKQGKNADRVYDQRGYEFIDKSISISGIEDALKAMGVCNKTELTPHGWRAMASTSYNSGLMVNGEKKDCKSKWVEAALSHTIKKKDGGKVAAAYNHAKYLPERIEMAQYWADFLWSSISTNPALKSSSPQSLELLAQPMHKSYRLT